MKKILFYLWQLPQTLIAFFILLLWKHEYVGDYKDKKCYVVKKFNGSMSLGEFLFFSSSGIKREENKAHERGHSEDSIKWGWLYLIVWGIPSILWAGIFHKSGTDYFRFYTEKSANKHANLESIYINGRWCLRFKDK